MNYAHITSETLEKKFGTLEVLQGIDFSLDQGESLAIIGSSGSGKTTLLRCLNFLERPDGGTITVNGQLIFDASDPSTQHESDIRKKRLHFGLVFQNFNLFPQYTALQNVVLAPKLIARERSDFGANKKDILSEIEEKGRAILEQVGLSDKLNAYPHMLSGGQQQRVAIARALAMEPDILCYEADFGARSELTGEVLKVIRSLASRNTTMVIVTHEMDFAQA